MKETPAVSMEQLPAHSVHCPACSKEFPAKFAKFGHSNYTLVGCESCPTLIALSELDPVILYLEGKFTGRPQDLQAAISRALMACSCGGKFKIFDDRRRCPLCKATLKEAQISGQVAGLGPEMRPIPGKLLAPGNGAWTNLDFLRGEIETAAQRYEASPSGLGPDGRLGDDWLAKKIYDVHFRKMTPEKLKDLMPERGDLFFAYSQVYHDHGGAMGPWWKFWSREVLYPEKCGIVFDIAQKELKCSSCGKSFPTRIA